MQDDPVKTSRFFISCYNLEPSVLSGFKVQRQRGGTVDVQYMIASFDKEASYGELYVEMSEAITSTKLQQTLEALDMCQVMVTTFSKEGRDDSCASAIFRIMQQQEKTGQGLEYGQTTEHVKNKLQAKLAEAEMADNEFDAKTAAAIKESLADMRQQVERVADGVNGMHPMLNEIENGICRVIPNYHEEIRKLETIIEHKTLLCDQVEQKLAMQTRNCNQMKRAKEEAELQLVKEREQFKAEIERFRETLEIATILQQNTKTLQDCKEIIELYISPSSESASKRARFSGC